MGDGVRVRDHKRGYECVSVRVFSGWEGGRLLQTVHHTSSPGGGARDRDEFVQGRWANVGIKQPSLSAVECCKGSLLDAYSCPSHGKLFNHQIFM
jgi:hypothetical protein